MKKINFLPSVYVFGSMLLIFIALFYPAPGNIKLIIRVLLLFVSFISWRVLVKKNLPNLGTLFFAFFILSLAFLVVTPFTPSFWNLKNETARGLALLKLSDSVVISSIIIGAVLVAGYRLKTIYLSKGRFLAGLIIGVLFFILFGWLALNNPQQKPEPGFIQKNWTWISIFVLANGFMEELIFRGIFLEKLNRMFNPFWSIFMTSVCFAAPHLTANYQADVLLFTGIVFVLGMICGYAMHYTRSIIAPVLIHAGADLMIIVPVFISYGVKV